MSIEVSIVLGLALGIPLSVLAWRNGSLFGSVIERCFHSWISRRDSLHDAKPQLDPVAQLEHPKQTEVAQMAARYEVTISEMTRDRADSETKHQKTNERLTRYNAEKDETIAKLRAEVSRLQNLIPKPPPDPNKKWKIDPYAN